MQAQTVETHVNGNSEQFYLEHLYKNLDQSLGHPAGDREICNEMNITLDEFHHMLDRMAGLEIGSFQKITSRDLYSNAEPAIKYIPDADAESSLIFRSSEIRETLTRAIEALPKLERTVTSLHYYDGLTLDEIEAVLGINKIFIAQLHTKAVLRLRSKLRKFQA